MVSQVPQPEIYLRNKAGDAFLKINGLWITKVRFEKNQGKILASLDMNKVREQELQVIMTNYPPSTRDEFVTALRRVKNHISTTYFSHQ
jgi:hypothetical protein